MKQAEIDYWIATMLESYNDVSDLNITAGRPLQIETAGVLAPVGVQPPVDEITPFQSEVFALNLIGVPSSSVSPFCPVLNHIFCPSSWNE